jgi:CHAT domain-containing protein
MSWDTANPFESALLLDDGDLKASNIVGQRIPNASLAFLSACETKKGDQRTPDAFVHLAATMFFAGF